MVNYSGRRENLISLADRPIEERRTIARAGGLASGRSRRKLAAFKITMRVCGEIIRDDLLEDLERELDEILKEQGANNG